MFYNLHLAEEHFLEIEKGGRVEYFCVSVIRYVRTVRYKLLSFSRNKKFFTILANVTYIRIFIRYEESYQIYLTYVRIHIHWNLKKIKKWMILPVLYRSNTDSVQRGTSFNEMWYTLTNIFYVLPYGNPNNSKQCHMAHLFTYSYWSTLTYLRT